MTRTACRPGKTLAWLSRPLVGVVLAGTASCSTPPDLELPELSLQPPPPPDEAGPGDGSGVMFAVTRFRVGTHTTEGSQDADAWRHYGYDLDRVSTIGNFDAHCQPAGGAAPNNLFPDGAYGIDNAFGKVLVPILRLAVEGWDADGGPTLEDSVNASLGSSTYGLVFHLRDLGTSASYDPLDAFVYRARTVAGSWAIAEESLDDPSAQSFDDALRSGKLHFSGSYVSDHVWVVDARASETDVIELVWDLGGAPLHLRIHRPIITMRMALALDLAKGGIIAGVLDAEESLVEARRWLGVVQPSFCEGSGVEGILNQIRQSVDMMADGTQSPGEICNGISIGLGFEAAATTATEISPAPAPEADPCAASP